MILVLLSLLAYPLQVSAQTRLPSPFYEYSPLTPRVGDSVAFNATRFVNYWKESTDAPVPSLAWDFGDGTPTQIGIVLTHTFTSPGAYWVSISDASGLGQTSAYEIKVTEQTPITIYESLSSDNVYIGQPVVISGNLTYNGIGVPRETVFFYTKVYLDEAPWVPIGSTTTGPDGSYTYAWATLKPSGYQVKATWLGNSTYPETSLTINLYVVSYGDFIRGFESNSTITGLSYNMTTCVVRFTAEGESGTGGYVNITLTKDSLFNPEKILVLLDNKPLPYTVDSTIAEWFLFFTYHHSTHNVIVDFTGASTDQTDISEPEGTREPPTPPSTSASPSNSINLDDRNPPHIPLVNTLMYLSVGIASATGFIGLLVILRKRHQDHYQNFA